MALKLTLGMTHRNRFLFIKYSRWLSNSNCLSSSFILNNLLSFPFWAIERFLPLYQLFTRLKQLSTAHNCRYQTLSPVLSFILFLARSLSLFMSLTFSTFFCPLSLFSSLILFGFRPKIPTSVVSLHLCN